VLAGASVSATSRPLSSVMPALPHSFVTGSAKQNGAGGQLLMRGSDFLQTMEGRVKFFRIGVEFVSQLQ